MQLRPRFITLAFVVGFALVLPPVRRANALEPLPIPPIPSPTPPIVVIAHPTPTPNPPAVTPEQSIPVVITYGQGLETRAQITRGLMEPVGIPFDKPVTVTLLLGSGIPGTLVHAGLYDGGQVASAVTPPNPPPILGNPVFPPAAAPIAILADQTVRFNFQSGRTLGLYRLLLTIGPKQYLLQFYAVRPRTVANPLPTPGPISTVPPDGHAHSQ